jgi:putative membrane protein
MDALRKLVLTLVINSLAVAITAATIPGIVYSGGIRTLFTIALIFGGVNMLIKPFLHIFSLPVEIATIGLASVFVNAAMLFLVAKFVAGFEILAFPFPGVNQGPFIIAPFMLPPYLTAILGAVLIGSIIAFLTWLTKNKS